LVDHHLVELFGGASLPAAARQAPGGAGEGLSEAPSDGDDELAAALSRAVASGRLGELLSNARERRDAARAALEQLDASFAGRSAAGLQHTCAVIERVSGVVSRSEALLAQVAAECDRTAPLGAALEPVLAEAHQVERARTYAQAGLLLAQLEERSASRQEFERLCASHDALCALSELAGAGSSGANSSRTTTTTTTTSTTPRGSRSGGLGSAVQGAPARLRLCDALASRIDRAVSHLREEAEGILQTALKQLHWPVTSTNPSLNASGAVQQSVSGALQALVSLQLEHPSPRALPAQAGSKPRARQQLFDRGARAAARPLRRPARALLPRHGARGA
jgi:hypothetical protein